jgi:serine/threonine protein kinase
VPKLLAVIDPLAFAVEHRGGSRFSRRRPWTFSPAFGRALEAAVREMHARGVVHLDLRHRSNVLVDARDEPVLIDFASAWLVHSRGRLARACADWLARLDRRAVEKWRQRIEPAASGAGAASASSGARRGASRPT